MDRYIRFGIFSLCFSLVILTVCIAEAGITINEIDLLNDRVELTNTSGSSIDISTWWFCNRVNGSPFYSQISSWTINTFLSSDGVGASLSSVDPGEYLIIDMNDNVLRDANGELGVYNTNSFGSASAIEDYTLWGANGIRDLTAQNAGIWTDNDSIDVSGMGAGDSIQLFVGAPGNSASEHYVGSDTIGGINSLAIPEPATAYLLTSGSLALLLRRRRRC